MTICEVCPQCGEEMEFEIQRDYQGDGVWGQIVETVEMVEQSCSCVLTDDELEVLRDKAFDDRADRESSGDLYCSDYL